MGDAAVVVTSDGDHVRRRPRVRDARRRRCASATFTQLQDLARRCSGMQGITRRRRALRRRDDHDRSRSTCSSSRGASACRRSARTCPPTVDLAYTVQDGLVVLGVGTRLRQGVLDTKPGQSLADQQRYQDAMASSARRTAARRTSTSRPASMRSRTLALPRPRPDGAEYQRDVQPYLEPLDAAAWSADRSTAAMPDPRSGSPPTRRRASSIPPATSPGGDPPPHGRQDPSDPRRCDEAADLPARRRRQPLRARWAGDRHDRALQPPHRTDRALHRRGQGQGLARRRAPSPPTPSPACSGARASLPAAK